jgi:hypothetical protein
MSFKIKTNNVNKILKDLNIEKKGKVQKFLDKTVRDNLMPYVSYKTGVQEQSIKNSTVLGSGEVDIGVPYAEYQAYSKTITKRVGKRGTQPFERMKSDKKNSILEQTAKYARSVDS